MGVTVLGSGSAGNAIVLHTAEGALLVDAGFSAKELRRRLLAAGIPEASLRAIIITHEHLDHVGALRVLANALKLPVYVNRPTAAVLRDKGQAPEAGLQLFTAGTAFSIGGFTIEPFSIPHDAADPMAFAIHWGGRKIGIATDLGHANPLVQHHLRECDLLMVESNHDPDMLWNSDRPLALKQRIRGRNGHLSNDDCAKLVQQVLHARTRHLVLAHASRDCNRYDLAESVLRTCLTGLGRAADLTLAVARQETPLPPLWV